MHDAVPPLMRHVLLTGTLLLLLWMTCTMWNSRFERVAELPTRHLSDLRQSLVPSEGVEWTGPPDDPALRLTVNRGNPPLALRLTIPGMIPVDALYLRFRMSSERLVEGPEKWQDGRFILEWVSAEGSQEERRDSVGSIKGDRRGPLESLVMQAPVGSWLPTLRLEHQGQSGAFELSELEITAVQESLVWTVGRWILALSWLAWAAACVRSWPSISWLRATLAAAIWVVLGMNFVIPGPWKVLRPLVSEFRLGAQSDREMSQVQTTTGSETTVQAQSTVSAETVVLGKMPDQGSLILQIKHVLSWARPLLHAILLFAPTLLFLVLAGRRPALFLAILLALFIELAQFSFDYGFGWEDVGDLLTDGFGIALAVYLHKIFQPYWPQFAFRDAQRRCQPQEAPSA